MSAWVTRGAGNGARVFYDGHCRPFLRLRDGTHPLAVGPCEPRPLAQARQIRPAAPAGARKPGTQPTDRLAGQLGRRQPNRRSGRDPGPRPYARTIAKPWKQGRKHYPIVSLPDQLAQRGSGHVQPLCGPAEVKLGGDRDERLKLPQFHT
jgi:hypothetical protein